MARPEVDASVILASYNQLDSTLLSLQALFAQKTGCRFEVIVCDDGSDAATIAAFRAALQSAPVPAYLTWQQDSGFRLAASRNNGIRLARGRILVFLDGDLVPEEDFVEKHVQPHEHDRVIAIGKRLYRNPDTVRACCCDAESLWTLLRSEQAIDRASRGFETLERLGRGFVWKNARWANCAGCNISVSKSSLVEFDEAFEGWGKEDWDLFYGLITLHGYEALLVDAAVYDVVGRVPEELWPQSKLIAHLRNGFRLLDKWAYTGIKPEFAIPRYEFDPETQLWSQTWKFRFGIATDDWPSYSEMARRWLLENGLYPSREDASDVADPAPPQSDRIQTKADRHS